MIAFQMMRDSIKNLLEKGGDFDRDELGKKLKVYETVADFDQQDCNILFDSGIYNDTLMAYCEKALQNVGLSDRAGEVRAEIYHLLDTVGSSRIKEGV